MIVHDRLSATASLKGRCVDSWGVFASSRFLGPAADVGWRCPYSYIVENQFVHPAPTSGGDWLQGPYVYALYTGYGYGVGDIGRLFIAGFGSSMIFGTVAGTLADKHGRKAAALAYVATYSLSCVTKHWSSFNVLLLGRFFGGVATSLLFSAFESWLVSEHMSRGYEEDWLGDTFSRAVLLGNGLVAILAGLVGNYLVDDLQLPRVAPFDAAIVVLLAGGATILLTWPENYGDHSTSRGILEQFWAAFHSIATDRRILLLGVMQAVFEGGMYTFVFLWTPTLSPQGEDIPYGFVFSMYMVSSMAGSAIAGHLFNLGYKPEKFMRWVFFVASLCMAVPIAFHAHKETDASGKAHLHQQITGAGMLQCLAFCIFEICIGIFWPSMMRLRAHYLPDEQRATLINFFRVPLNLFVCIVLYNVAAFPLSVMFGLCSVFMLINCACCNVFASILGREERTNKGIAGLL